MNVIPPITITDAILTSSNVAEDDYAEWDVATTYALADRVIVVDTNYHMIFESLQADNLGHDPLDDDQDAPVYWVQIGPTNRWRMFDVLRNTKTEAASPITVVLTPSQRINSIALLGLEADTVHITMTNDGETVYDSTTNLIERQTLNWSDYFFGEFGNQIGVAMFDLPPFTAGIITVTISRVGDVGNVACGSLVLGNFVYIGAVQYSAVSDSINFSVVDRDEFGNAELNPRRSIPKTEQTLFVNKDRVNKLLNLRDDLNAAPAVWSGLDDATDGYFNALLILGFYRQFRINLDFPTQARLDLELEEI